MNDGTFGTTAEVGGLDPEVVEAIENHRFDPLRDVQWRNSDLHFHSVPALIASLNRPPQHAAPAEGSRTGRSARPADPVDPFGVPAAAAHAAARKTALGSLPGADFRKTMTEEHTRLLGQLFEHLTQGGERLPEDWIDSHIKRLEHYDGDIDTLMARIAHVRTWTYISHRPDWIQRSVHWQERTRAIEDKLSDVLHQRLTQRFVDRRAALLVRRLRDEGEMTSSVAAAGEVSVEGEHLGRIEGFRFVPDTTEGQTDQKAVLSAALRALRQDLPARLQAFAGSADGELVFDSQLRVCWGGGPVARLLPSGDILAPKVEALPSDLLDGPAREEVRKRAATWVETRIRLGLSELMDARATAELPAGARGIIFQLCEGLGVLARRPIEEQLAQLNEEDRKALARLGVRVGVYSLYFPSMLKPVPIRLRAGLWMVAQQPRDHPAAAGRRPHLDGSAAGRAARFLRHHRLPATGRPRHPRRHGRAPGGDGAPCRARKPRGSAARAAAAAAKEAPTEPAATAAAAAPSTDEISEWAIVAAAFGESEPTPAEPVAEAAAEERRRRRSKAVSEPAPAEEAVAEAPAAEEADRRDEGRRDARRGQAGRDVGGAASAGRRRGQARRGRR